MMEILPKQLGAKRILCVTPSTESVKNQPTIVKQQQFAYVQVHLCGMQCSRETIGKKCYNPEARSV